MMGGVTVALKATSIRGGGLVNERCTRRDVDCGDGRVDVPADESRPSYAEEPFVR